MYLSFGFPVWVSDKAIGHIKTEKLVSAQEAQEWIADQVTKQHRTVLVQGNKYGGMDVQHALVSTDLARFSVSLAWQENHPVLLVHEVVKGTSREAGWMLRCQEQKHLSRIAQDNRGTWHWCGHLLQPLPVCDFWDKKIVQWGVMGTQPYQIACQECLRAHQAWLSRRGLGAVSTSAPYPVLACVR